jgi:hypothetical protein
VNAAGFAQGKESPRKTPEFCFTDGNLRDCYCCSFSIFSFTLLPLFFLKAAEILQTESDSNQNSRNLRTAPAAHYPLPYPHSS